MNIKEESLELHKKLKGKLETMPKCDVKTSKDISLLYTPGVAYPCLEIKEDVDKAYEYTMKYNTIAIITNGTRVLGLGNIGCEASLPVMEGKALLFKRYGAVDAVPLPINERDVDKFVEIVSKITPAFGGINLEDIESPQCFKILEVLRDKLNIPVWHDDQQGTATVILAGLINATKIVGKDLKDCKIVVFGIGAANTATVKLLEHYGVDIGNVVIVDSKGILNREREDLKNTYKWEFCVKSNKEGLKGDLSVAIKDADILIAASKPGPGTIDGKLIEKMNEEAIVFALANPVPEIMPEEAKKHGAKIVATGRSDYPNQVNNSLIFPAMFRGVLSVMAKKISEGMMVKAAETLAKVAEEKMNETYILPKMEEYDSFCGFLATEIGMEAIRENLVRRKISKEKLREEIEKMLEENREKLIKLGRL